MAQTHTTQNADVLLRVHVKAMDQQLDIAVPSTTPVVELLPGFARHLGHLDTELVYGGYQLALPDGTLLEPSLSLVAQGVAEGTPLTLVIGALEPQEKVYDDIVEAVGDVVSESSQAWTTSDSTKVAAAASIALLGIAAGALLLSKASPLLTAAVAAAAMAAIMAAAAVLSRTGERDATAQAIAATGAVFAAVIGYSAAFALGLGQWALAGACGGLVVGAFLGFVCIKGPREFLLVPFGIGGALGIGTILIIGLELKPAGILAVIAAIVVTLGNAIPWMSVSASGLKVITPLSDREVYSQNPEIDRNEVERRYRNGNRLQMAARLTSLGIALICAPFIASDGMWGTLLCGLMFVGVMLSMRQTYARAEVLTMMAGSVLGVLLTAGAAALSHPQWRTGLAIALVAAATIIVVEVLLSTRTRPVLGRIADAIDMIALIALLPLAVLITGMI